MIKVVCMSTHAEPLLKCSASICGLVLVSQSRCQRLQLVMSAVLLVEKKQQHKCLYSVPALEVKKQLLLLSLNVSAMAGVNMFVLTDSTRVKKPETQ